MARMGESLVYEHDSRLTATRVLLAVAVALILISLSCGEAEKPTEPWDDLNTGPNFRVSIEVTPAALPGHAVEVGIDLENAPATLVDFDLLVVFDSAMLDLEYPSGSDLTECDFGSFNVYSQHYSHFPGVPSGGVRITGRLRHYEPPSVWQIQCQEALERPIRLTTLRFQVSDNPELLCEFIPIQFFWCDAGDSYLWYLDDGGDQWAGVSRTVSDRDAAGARSRIDNAIAGYPTLGGFQTHSEPEFPNAMEWKPVVDFVNGGVRVFCDDSSELLPGDFDLSGTAFEQQDYDLFRYWFLFGNDALPYDSSWHAAASDANCDGARMTLVDLEYLWLTIMGYAIPHEQLTPDTVRVSVNDGYYALDGAARAAWVVVEGTEKPKLLLDRSTYYLQSGTDQDKTRILVRTNAYPHSFEGDFLQVEGDLLDIDVATLNGGPVVIEMVE